MKERELYKVIIEYTVNEYDGEVNKNISYMRLDEGEKNLLYWLEESCILYSVDMYAIDEVEIVEF